MEQEPSRHKPPAGRHTAAHKLQVNQPHCRPPAQKLAPRADAEVLGCWKFRRWKLRRIGLALPRRPVILLITQSD